MTASSPHRRPVVYLHVGEPKSGTTFLQQVMWNNRATLARQGVLLPGHAAQDHYRAAQDLREVVQSADDPTGSYRGEWKLLCEHVMRADVSVISHELLAGATEAQAMRALSTLARAEVHVVLTVRDFVTLLPAEWQETVKHRNTGTWQHWVRRMIRNENSQRSPGPWFWRVHGTLGVLQRWTQGVPAERVHVITVPPPGSPTDLLWRRFASVIGVDPDSVELDAARQNTSLGHAETELLRRLNVALGRDAVPDWYYAVRVKERLAHEILADRPASARPRLTAKQEQWARERAEKVVAGLAGAGYDIVGNLADLVPRPIADDEPQRTGRVPDAAVLDAAVDVIAALVRNDYGSGGLRLGADGRPRKAAVRPLAKRWVRDMTTRHAAFGRLRVVAWRWLEGMRAKRRS